MLGVSRAVIAKEERKIARLTPMQGFRAETGGDHFGSLCPFGRSRLDDSHDRGRYGRRRRLALGFGRPPGVAKSIVTAWIVTLPAASLIAAASAILDFE